MREMQVSESKRETSQIVQLCDEERRGTHCIERSILGAEIPVKRRRGRPNVGRIVGRMHVGET